MLILNQCEQTGISHTTFNDNHQTESNVDMSNKSGVKRELKSLTN